jgi:hypothetical protein
MQDYIEYIIPTHYITAIVYGDYSALSDDEQLEVEAFITGLQGSVLVFPTDTDTDTATNFEISNDLNRFACDCIKAKLLIEGE